MGPRSSWLFPLMVLAAISVTIFGCVGIAAIMGYVPMGQVVTNPLAADAGSSPAPPNPGPEAPQQTATSLRPVLWVTQSETAADASLPLAGSPSDARLAKAATPPGQQSTPPDRRR